jgi:adenylate cyclase
VDQLQRVERKLAAILAADVVGYSRLMGLDETGTLARLKALRREFVEPLISGYNGRIVKLMGDGALVEFPSVVDAVACAVEIQRVAAEQAAGVPEEQRIAFRIGINLGDVIIDGDDVYGDGVNIAARLEGLSEPGGIVVSGTAYDHAHNKLAVAFKPLGDQHLKNIAEPVRVYRVLLDQVGAKKKVRPRRWMLPAAAALLLVIVAGAVVALWPRALGLLPGTPSPTTGLPADKPSIAVLPFGNLSDSADQDYFAEGLSDDLITDLSKISGLFVIARNSTFAYKEQAVDVRQVAEQLGVRYVLQGSVRRAGEAVRINVQLIDATTGRNVWTERYDRDYANIFALQDEVITQIVKALSVQLTKGEEAQIARLPTDNLEAYDFYIRAEQKVYAVGYEPLGAALSLYQRAIALDPEFADAYAGYARAIVDVLSFDYERLMQSAVSRQQAYEAAGRALQLNPQLPRAYAVLGILQMLDGEFGEAIASVEKAVALDPSGADAELNRAIVLTYAGQHAEALAAMDRVLLLDPKPRPQFYDYYGLVLYMNRRYEDAVATLLKIQPDEQSDFGVEVLAMAYARLGRTDDARRAIEMLLTKKSPARSLVYLRVIYGHHQRKEDLDHRLDALRDAGLPEWPFDFRGRSEDRLDGAAIQALAVGKTWNGHQHTGEPFLMQVSARGDYVQRAPQGMVTGKITFEADRMCMQSAAVLLGRKFCSPVYRNPGGSSEKQNEYVFPDVATVWYFSVAP